MAGFNGIKIVDVNYRDPLRVKSDGYEDHLVIDWPEHSCKVLMYSYENKKMTVQVFDKEGVDDLITVLTYWRDNVCSQ